MSYMALYRKFRPQTFDEVRGQEAIVTTLKNQIIQNRIGHAYLFCGTRGTGKTTLAKIMARAVNCEHPVDGNPCMECDTCKAIANGTTLNVVEMDAASNSGVDKIRELINEVEYKPTMGKYRVYIIDEAHNLSPEAFNALLKTLEEPPEHVIFILATTEAHKILVTISSRCQKYDFKRIPLETISGRMRELLERENIQATDDAIRYVAKVADGSMRDGLSLLDQCIAFYPGEELTLDRVLISLGAVKTDIYSKVFNHIIEQNVTGVIKDLEEVMLSGTEISRFVTDLTWYFRNIMIIKSSDAPADVLDVTTESFQEMKEDSEKIELGTVMRFIRILAELTGSLKLTTQGRVLTEMTLIKLCTPQMDRKPDAIMDRIRNIEKKLENGVFTVASETSGDSSSQPVIAATRVELPEAIPEDIQQIRDEWSSILSDLHSLNRGYMVNVDCSMDSNKPDTLILVCKKEIAYKGLKEPQNAQILQGLLNERVRKEVKYELVLDENGSKYDKIPHSKVPNIEIETDDSFEDDQDF
ncbi:MAG: DNA polymerase III subunit gamma/tau [Lachnospiraceae bacterium]|nr:DNA polymerase III subunit gamma/tau [Lachnospiraceae bacterium]